MTVCNVWGSSVDACSCILLVVVCTLFDSTWLVQGVLHGWQFAKDIVLGTLKSRIKCSTSCSA